MPLERKRLRAAVAEAEGSRTHRAVVNDSTSSPADTADTYQLAVVNACLTNEDIRLPCAPTPALLSSFYSNCNTIEVENAASPISGFTPWKAEYWLRRVAHVLLGRHSALPDAFRLRHDFASRLHARVVYIRTPAMHKRFAKYFPCITGDDETLRGTEEEQQRGAEKRVEEDADVVIVESGDARSATSSPPPLSPAFVSPYYLIINYSENAVYVGGNCVPRGRSARLQEGDVISFLECAFDDEGGVLGAVNSDPSSTHDKDVFGAAKKDTLVEPIRQLAFASLQQHLPGVQPSMSSFPLYAQHRLIAYRRLYDVPADIQEYVKWWWSAQAHPTAELTSSSSGLLLCPASTSTLSSSNWLVSGNHLVRAPSVTRSAAALATPDHPPPPCRDEDNAVRAPLSPPISRSNSVAGSVEHFPFNINALQNPAVATSLRQWLDDTEGMAEISDTALSPLSVRLKLDRSWLRLVLRRLCGSQRQERSSSMRASLLGSAEKTSNAKVERSSPLPLTKLEVEADGDEAKAAAGHVVESFRVSLLPLRGDSAPPSVLATPTREPSVMQTVLDELRRSRSEDFAKAQSPRNDDSDGSKVSNAQTSCCHANVPVHRSLHLDENVIELFMDNSPHKGLSEARTGHTSSHQKDESASNSLPLASATHADSSLGVAGHATDVPGVRLEAAVLPVYVFTRRSHSPDVYTREGASLRPFSPTSRDKAMAAAASAAQHVYYFDLEESQGGEGAERSPKARDHSASNPTLLAATAGQLPQAAEGAQQLVSSSALFDDRNAVKFEWIDKSEGKQVSEKRRKGRARKRPL
ncbi:hypothetical protein ABL78_4601 [Leptomonas seymouri]|uniref:FHA domain-containing protein n=1 Tax=Leptomonas seymouri TaxID=5684 RepID=A0A0N1PDY7_LEPSE|nr:hypothetical protein ABL78_4601 [Leptomonas seymouri]|eukprot:KPI86335.1 hypothetical protein ABL78_4601 [Leptomonas seymouri]